MMWTAGSRLKWRVKHNTRADGLNGSVLVRMAFTFFLFVSLTHTLLGGAPGPRRARPSDKRGARENALASLISLRTEIALFPRR